MISKVRSQQAAKALYDKAKQATPLELPSVVKLQVRLLDEGVSSIVCHSDYHYNPLRVSYT